MISKLALKTAKIFVNNSKAQYDDEKIYQYGFFVLYSNIVFFIITVIFGIILN